MDFGFLFPGQGSQSLGMMDGFKGFKVVRDTFEEASDVLKVDLLKLVEGDDIEAINQTEITQPLVLTSSISTLRVYQSLSDISPVILAGHSLGEYSALVAANSLKFSDAVFLVSTRGKLMQGAVEEGKGLMAAILGLSDDEVISICDDASSFGVVEAVNFNSPEQIVIAGEKLAVEEAIRIAKDRKAKRAIPLNVSAPSHCKLMRSVADKFKEVLDGIKFNVPSIDIINNVDVSINSSEVLIKDALVRQLYSPVCWTQTIRKIYDMGVLNLVECNPSKVLSGLVKRINKEINCISFCSIDNINNFISSIN